MARTVTQFNNYQKRIIEENKAVQQDFFIGLQIFYISFKLVLSRYLKLDHQQEQQQRENRNENENDQEIEKLEVLEQKKGGKAIIAMALITLISHLLLLYTTKIAIPIALSIVSWIPLISEYLASFIRLIESGFIHIFFFLPILLLFSMRYIRWSYLDELFKHGLILAERTFLPSTMVQPWEVPLNSLPFNFSALPLSSSTLGLFESEKTLTGNFGRLPSLYSQQVQHSKDFSLWLYSLPLPNTWESFKGFCVRTAKKLLIGLLFYILSCIPFVGKYVFPLIQFYLSLQIIGPIGAVLLTALSYVNFLQIYSGLIFSHWFATRALSQELLEPYLRRLRLTSKERKEFFKKNLGLLLGFTTPFIIVTNFFSPFITPLFFLFAQETISFVVLYIVDREAARIQELIAIREQRNNR